MLPPYPYRPLQPYSLLRWALLARDNSAAIWPQVAFSVGFMEQRLPGRRLYLLNSAQSVRHVLVTHAAGYQKSRDTRRMLEPLIGDGLFISEGDLWQRQRRLITPALNGRLPEFFPLMLEVGREMVERWAKRGSGAEIEMGREMTRVTAEVVSRALMSFELGVQRTDRVYAAFSRYQDSLGRLDLLGLLGAPAWLPRPGEGKARAAARQLDAVMDAILAAHGGPRERVDTLDLLLQARDDHGQPLPLKLLRDELKVLFLAGHETTANTLVWTLFLLARSPEAQGRLQQELDARLGSREPELEDIQHLPYARALVQEALRLYPPIHLFAREALESDSISGHHIPAGSLMVVAPWLLHRHRRYWQEPDAFRPERFLERDPRRPKHCYIPFSAGPRLCPGADFGMTEAILILAMAARRFRFQLRPNHPVEPLGRLTLRPRHGLPLRLEPR